MHPGGAEDMALRSRCGAGKARAQGQTYVFQQDGAALDGGASARLLAVTVLEPRESGNDVDAPDQRPHDAKRKRRGPQIVVHVRVLVCEPAGSPQSYRKERPVQHARWRCAYRGAVSSASAELQRAKTAPHARQWQKRARPSLPSQSCSRLCQQKVRACVLTSRLKSRRNGKRASSRATNICERALAFRSNGLLRRRTDTSA